MPQYCKPIPPLTETQIRNFYDKVDDSSQDDCHPWMGATTDSGYGVCLLWGKRFRATRVMYFLLTGTEAGDLLLRHRCDNKICVRFDHLEVGTNDENMTDAKSRGRFASGSRNGANTHPEKIARGEAQKLSVLTNDLVLEIRHRYSKKETCESIAMLMGVSPDVVSKVVRGIMWAHVGGPVVAGRLPKTGKREPYAEITNHIIEGVMKDRLTGMSAMELVVAYGISRASVYNIISKKRRP